MSAALLARIEHYLIANKMSMTYFGESCGPHDIVANLRKGRPIKPETAARVEAFLAGPVPVRPAPVFRSAYPTHPLHDCPVRFERHVAEASAKLVRRQFETGQYNQLAA